MSPVSFFLLLKGKLILSFFGILQKIWINGTVFEQNVTFYGLIFVIYYSFRKAAVFIKHYGQGVF